MDLRDEEFASKHLSFKSDGDKQCFYGMNWFDYHKSFSNVSVEVDWLDLTFEVPK